MKTDAEVIADLVDLLSNFQGREYSSDIGRETLFHADLGLVSIDAVLGESLEKFYGQKLPFNAFLADAARREAQDISVGELADFLAQHVGTGGGERVAPTMLAIDGTTLHYQQHGSGPDVILIHAFTSNMAIWALTGIVEELAQDNRVTTYDLRGHGLSGVTLSGYNSAQMAADLRQLHRALGLEPAHLVGHSFGGVIAIHAALDYPEMVASVVLSDTYFPGLRHQEPSMGEIDVWTDLRDQLRELGVDLGDSVDFGQLISEAAAWSPQQFAEVEDALGTATARWLAQISQLAGTRAGEEMFDECGLTAERISQVQQPVTALYDEFSPFEATCDYLQQHLGDCRVDVVPGAKHMAPVQNPRALAELVRKHLDRVAD